MILADAGATLAWQEPVSSFFGSIRQDKAEEQLDQTEQRFAKLLDSKAVRDAEGLEAKARVLANIYEDRLKTGEGMGRIQIPEIDANFVIVHGTDTASLQRGPGHYPETSIPGQGKTIGIAGHRTTYLAPFRKINDLDKRDDIQIKMPYATFIYKVEKSEIVTPDRTDVVDDIGRERLVLTACHPLYSAAQRYVIFARLHEIRLFSVGEGRWPDP